MVRMNRRTGTSQCHLSTLVQLWVTTAFPPPLLVPFFLRPCLCCHLKTTLLLLLLLLLRVLSASFEFIEFACAAKGGGGMVLLVGVVDTSSAWKEKEKEPWPAKWVSVINAISAQECPIPQWFSFSWSAAHLPPRKLLRLSFVFALAFLAMTTTGTTMMIAINEINAYLKEPDRRINWRKWSVPFWAIAIKKRTPNKIKDTRYFGSQLNVCGMFCANMPTSQNLLLISFYFVAKSVKF